MSDFCRADLDFGDHWFICHLPDDGHAKHVHDMHDPEVMRGIHYTVTWDAEPQTVDANPSRMEIT